MIDFTTVQLTPVPPPIIELQRENNNLKDENKIANTIILVIALSSIAILGYLVYNEHQKRALIALKRNKDEVDIE